MGMSERFRGPGGDDYAQVEAADVRPGDVLLGVYEAVRVRVVAGGMVLVDVLGGGQVVLAGNAAVLVGRS